MYNIIVIAKQDEFSTNAFVYENLFNVTGNEELIIGPYQNLTVTIPNGLAWDWGSTWIQDPEGVLYSRSIKFDGSATIPSWFVYDLYTYQFNLTTSASLLPGLHTIEIEVDDGVNGIQEVTISINILDHLAPVSIKPINEFSAVLGTAFVFQLELVNEYFQDPEGSVLTSYVTSAGGLPLPPIFSYNNLTDQLLVFATDKVSVRTWILEYFAVDAPGKQTSKTFKVTVKSNICEIIL